MKKPTRYPAIKFDIDSRELGYGALGLMNKEEARLEEIIEDIQMVTTLEALSILRSAIEEFTPNVNKKSHERKNIRRIRKG
jgi:Ni,Fe-hydrogenase I large subunit